MKKGDREGGENVSNVEHNTRDLTHTIVSGEYFRYSHKA